MISSPRTIRKVKVLQIKLDAGALYFVLVTSILIALITGSIFMVISLNQQLESKIDNNETLLRNLLSAQQIVLHEQSLEKEKWYVFDLFENSTDSVAIFKKNWGLLELAVVKSMRNGDDISRVGFIGIEQTLSKRTALTLEDRNRPLSLCGNTNIIGNVSVPKAGVKRAYIEGKTFQGNQLIQGQIVDIINDPQYYQNSEALSLMEELITEGCSEHQGPLHSYSHSFFEDEPQFVFASTTLENCELKGQIIVYSNQEINIDSSCHFEDVIFLAPIIRIGYGFKGSGQFIATDSLIVAAEAKLSYPSALYLNRKEVTNAGVIRIEENASINGIVALYDDSGYRSKGIIEIQQGAQVNGEVFSNGSIDHKGVIHGMLETSRFMLNTPSSVYENHLLDATIDCESISSDYAFLQSRDKSGNRTFMKWLK